MATKPTHTFVMSEEQTRNIHRVVSGHIAALKNWIATGVETGAGPGNALEPTKLVAELREYEALFAAFNIEAKMQSADATGKPLETTHHVRNRRHD